MGCTGSRPPLLRRGRDEAPAALPRLPPPRQPGPAPRVRRVLGAQAALLHALRALRVRGLLRPPALRVAEPVPHLQADDRGRPGGRPGGGASGRSGGRSYIKSGGARAPHTQYAGLFDTLLGRRHGALGRVRLYLGRRLRKRGRRLLRRQLRLEGGALPRRLRQLGGVL